MILTPTAENLTQVTAYLDAFLDSVDAPPKVRIALETALEEVFVNIALYSGATFAAVDVSQENGEIALRFSDNGVPYNPLLRDDPDVTLPAEERSIGGLGILMVKRMTDRQTYEYTDGHNLLTLYKRVA